MKDFLHFLAQTPAAFWGSVVAALVASLLTLAGVYITIRASNHRQDREREMTFRRDTYAAAAEVIFVWMSALAKFSDLGFSQKEITATYLDKSPALAKVNLVAKEDTIRALANFSAGFTGAFLRLTQQRMVLCVLQEQIATQTALLRGFEKTRDAMVELMRHHNIDGVQDPRRFEAIQKNYEFEADRIATTNEELQRMIAELAAKQIPFAKECFVELARTNQLTIPLLVAARGDLEIPISEERYAEIFRQAQSKQEGQLDEFIKNVAPVNAIVPNS